MDYVIKAYNKWNSFNVPAGDESPAQRPKNESPAASTGGQPRARRPAHEKTDRKKDREEVRTASPDVRTSSARAAQRLGGADAQHAPNQDQKQSQDQEPPPVADAPAVGDSLEGLEHLTGPELARAALKKADLGNGRNRIPMKMWKYPREFTRLSEPESDTEPLGEDQ